MTEKQNRPVGGRAAEGGTGENSIGHPDSTPNLADLQQFTFPANRLTEMAATPKQLALITRLIGVMLEDER